MTQTQTKHDGTGRRMFMKGIAASATAATGIGAMSSTASAASLSDLAGIGITGPAYLVSQIENPFGGDISDEYDETNADATQAQIVENGLDMHQSNVAVTDSMLNLLASSRNFVIAESKKAAIDVFEDGGSTSDAEEAAKNEIDDFYRTQQENLITHWEFQISRVKDFEEQISNTDGLEITSFWAEGYDIDDTETISDPDDRDNFTRNATLVDGEDVDVQSYVWPDGTSSGRLRLEVRAGSTSQQYNLYTRDLDGEDQFFFDSDIFGKVWEEIEDEHEEITNEMETFVNDVGAEYQVGDIDIEDMISPNDLIGDAAEQDDLSFASASLASMGLSSSNYALDVELVDSDVIVQGSIYHNDDELDTLETGTEYDPDDIDGVVYLSYNDDTGGDLIQLDEPFVILNIEDSDGNEFEEATYESRNQQTFDTETEQIQEELDQIVETRLKLEEERDQLVQESGGAGGFGGDSSTLAAAAAIGGAIILLFGGGS